MVQQHLARSLIALMVFVSLAVLGATLTARALNAQTTVTSALYTISINTTNIGSTDLASIQAPFNISVVSLIDGSFLSSDALTAIVQKSGTDIPSMPATGLIQVEGAIQFAGATYTEYTTAAQNAAQNDIPVLPGSPAVNDAIYFGCDNPCRIITWDTDTAGVGTWTITYEYWDGSNFTALSNVDDRTNGFTVLGQKAVTWDMPADWATRTITGSAVSSYWGRARVSAFTSITTQPLASRIRYENGQWWTWIADLDVDNQEQVTLYFGGPSNLVTSHQLFPGVSGIITGDTAGLELGSAYSVAVNGRLDFSAAAADACILCKTGAITVNVSGSASNAVIGTLLIGTGGNSAADTPSLTIPDAGAQTVIVASDGVSASATWVDAGGFRSYAPQTITDTANNLTWASNSGVDYIEAIRLDVAVATVFDFDTGYTDFTGGTLTNTDAYTGALGLANE